MTLSPALILIYFTALLTAFTLSTLSTLQEYQWCSLCTYSSHSCRHILFTYIYAERQSYCWAYIIYYPPTTHPLFTYFYLRHLLLSSPLQFHQYLPSTSRGGILFPASSRSYVTRRRTTSDKISHFYGNFLRLISGKFYVTQSQSHCTCLHSRITSYFKQLSNHSLRMTVSSLIIITQLILVN